MLVLSRKLSQTIVIDGGIRITVVGLRGNQVRLGIEAPDSVGIYREELCVPIRDVGDGGNSLKRPRRECAEAASEPAGSHRYRLE
jgi:carbon storage regulator